MRRSPMQSRFLRRLLWRSLWDALEIEYIMATPVKVVTNQEELINRLEEPCRGAAEAMLCHYAFPGLECGPVAITIIITTILFLHIFYCFLSDCVIRSGDAAGLPLCYEDCVALRQQVRFLILDQPYICSETAG